MSSLRGPISPGPSVDRALQGTGTGQWHTQARKAAWAHGRPHVSARPWNSLQCHYDDSGHPLSLHCLLVSPSMAFPLCSQNFVPCGMCPGGSAASSGQHLAMTQTLPNGFCLGVFQQQLLQLQPLVLAGSILRGASEGPSHWFCGKGCHRSKVSLRIN